MNMLNVISSQHIIDWLKYWFQLLDFSTWSYMYETLWLILRKFSYGDSESVTGANFVQIIKNKNI